MSWPIRWDLLLRYRLIEIIAQWEGRLTTKHLCDSFGIGRQQASKDINLYLKDVAPGNLIYDKHIKGYIPSPTFTAKLTSNSADEYLQVMSRNKDITQTFSNLNLGLPNSELLKVPSRNVRPEVLRPLIQAAREQKRVEIGYISLTSPDVEDRIIVPHTLVCTPLRWHLRAYCEKNRDYRDFVLSRFRQTPEILDQSQHGCDGDERWNSDVTLTLMPDPRLNQAQQDVVAHDYGMQGHRLEFVTRGALVVYALQAFNIDPRKQDAKPTAQQIVVANYETIEPFLF